MIRNHPSTRRLLSLLAVPLLAVAACGGDDDDADDATTIAASVATSASTSGPGSSEDIDAFCTASVEAEAAAIQAEAETGGEETPEAGKAYAGAILPFAEQLAASAPADVRTEVEALAADVAAAAASGDASTFESPAFTANLAAMHGAGVEACGWEVHDVEMQDYHFVGVPDSLPAGVTSFELANTGAELHEFMLMRKNDGVTESFEELLGLPEEEAFGKVTPVASGFAMPGESGYALVDLSAGDYLAICFLPIGLTGPDATPAPDAAPHFTAGMQHEFTVP